MTLEEEYNQGFHGMNCSILDIEIGQLRWKPILWRNESFPWHRQALPNARARDTVAGPHVYRWTMLNSLGEISSSYIGETGNFLQRLRAYRISSQDGETSIVCPAMRKCEKNGGRVELFFLDLGTLRLSIDGKSLPNCTVADHDVRLYSSELPS
jgi:hypothetical protein